MHDRLAGEKVSKGRMGGDFFPCGGAIGANGHAGDDAALADPLAEHFGGGGAVEVSVLIADGVLEGWVHGGPMYQVVRGCGKTEVFATPPTVPYTSRMRRKAVIAVGHRGASAYAPENTVAAFDEAIRLGAKAVEFDLRATAEGMLVVLHDETVDRTTNGKGRVSEIEWSDLIRLDAGSWIHGRFAAARIPSLEEALLAIGPSARPVIELKVPVSAELLLTALRKYDLEEEALILSFDAEWLVPFRKMSGKICLGLLAETWSDELPGRAKGLDCELLALHTDILSPPQIAAADAQGLEVWAFTANDVGMVAACAALGVTGIITDRPDLIHTREAPPSSA